MKTLTISSHYPNAALANLPGGFPSQKEILASAGMSPGILGDFNTRVPVSNYARLYQLASRKMDDEAFGYLPGRLPHGTFSIGAEYAAHSENVGQALTKICRYYRVVSDDIRPSVQPYGNHIAFDIWLRAPQRDRYALITEIFLCIGYRFTSWLAGRNIDLVQSQFAYDAPAHVHEYAFLFPCPLLFGQSGNSRIIFDRRFLEMPVLKSTGQIAEFLARTPYDLMNKLLGGNSLSARVYGALNQRTTENAGDLPSIAADLRMTEQTLRRKLRAEGATFRGIKHQLRKDTAIYHLTNSEQTLTEIADLLGFSTPGAFSRAFKNWTGCAPDYYRRGTA